jgi:hypothetical protein
LLPPKIAVLVEICPTYLSVLFQDFTFTALKSYGDKRKSPSPHPLPPPKEKKKRKENWS